jgi:type 2 lantibiotic biosynthesis protein LanM
VKTASSIEEGTQWFSESSWYHALTLTERIEPLRNSYESAQSCPSDQLTQAMKRLEQWKNQSAFRNSDLFAERLAMDAITEQELLMLLAEPVEQLQKRFMEQDKPEWISKLQHIWETVSFWSEKASEPGSSNPAYGLFDALKPLTELGCNLLCQGIQRIADASQQLPFDPATVHHLFLPHLRQRLQQVATRTLILEMHIARLEERLSGDTPEERFTNFMHQLCQPDCLYALLSEYPLLARIMLTILHHWVDYSLEIVEHLCTDWSKFLSTFALETDPGSLIGLDTGAGDTHRSGRSVAILHFSSGFRLVYKPRSLSLDQHFQELLAWVNALGIAQPLRTLTILEAGNHGWVEFVQEHGCSTQEEVKHFYERQGSYLALLYALDATDFHHENILAAGEHPVLVDLEALFHSHLGEKKPGVEDSAARSIGYSVQRTGLLPARMQLEDGGAGLDISGLGGWGGQLTPRPVSVWKAEGTDQMHMTRERREIPTSKNRPTLLGKDVEVADYTDDILKGFTETYRLLMHHREAWLTHILPRFERDEVRVILRATRTYAILLSESFHPERLGDTFERERLLDNLWDGVSYQSYLRRAIAAERRDLLQGDIPLFTSQPGSRDLFTSRGERIADFCSESGMELAKQRIRAMDERDLALQQWIIRASLVSTIMGDRYAPKVPLRPSSSVAVTHEQLIQAASSIGTRLADLAVHGEHGVNWLGISAVSESQSGTIWQLQPAGLTLYDGLPGILLFLSYLGRLTGDSWCLDLADMALLTLQEQIEKSKSFETPQSIGAFSGLGSLIYLFAHLSVLREDDAFLLLAQELVEEVEQLIEQDKQFDIIAGSAGCIACLLALYQVAPSARTLQVAIHCGDHLLSHAHELVGGLGWYVLGQETALAGFSHGAAGIALSLFRLAHVSQRERFHQAALAALMYERSLFSPEHGNWMRFPDRREQDLPVAWCHGAPGIGLARLASLPYLDDAQIRQEIQIALETTRKKSFGNNQSLCHGDLGNLETLLTATQMLDNADYREDLKRLTALILGGIQEHGWVTGVPLGVETPALMVGLAGIGYELLRLAAPEKVPSVLLLAPPPSKVHSRRGPFQNGGEVPTC